MYQRIDERVEVAGVYHQRGFTPKRFRWHGRVYEIKEVTMMNDAKDGGRRLRFYSVVVEGTVYRLRFDRDGEAWLLEEVWYEG